MTCAPADGQEHEDCDEESVQKQDAASHKEDRSHFFVQNTYHRRHKVLSQFFL